jgi:pantothenate kinase type III
MLWGVLLASAGGIQESVRMLKRRAGTRSTCFVTGGYSTILKPLLPPSWHFDPHLTLVGLAVIAELNTR